MWFDLERGEGPLHEQIAGAMRSAILNGDIRPGGQLPPARAAAEALGVNMHTVLRAYRALEDEGMIRLRRGQGATVLEAGQSTTVARLVERLIAEAERCGVGRDEIVRMIREAP